MVSPTHHVLIGKSPRIDEGADVIAMNLKAGRRVDRAVEAPCALPVFSRLRNREPRNPHAAQVAVCVVERQPAVVIVNGRGDRLEADVPDDEVKMPEVSRHGRPRFFFGIKAAVRVRHALWSFDRRCYKVRETRRRCERTREAKGEEGTTYASVSRSRHNGMVRAIATTRLSTINKCPRRSAFPTIRYGARADV